MQKFKYAFVRVAVFFFFQKRQTPGNPVNLKNEILYTISKKQNFDFKWPGLGPNLKSEIGRRQTLAKA